MMVVMTLSANAQITHSNKFTEVVPEQSTTESTMTQSDSTVTEVMPKQSITITENPSTTHTEPAIVTEIIPGPPVITSTVTEVFPQVPATTVTSSSITTTATTSTDTGTVGQKLDPAMARRHLSVKPQTVTITPEQRTALDRTLVIESKTEPVRRVYNVERNVVIVEEQGKSIELPYVTLPVLFVVDTAELLDAESRAALEQTASVINEIVQTEPNALFDVEGHTSMEGSAEHNMSLSAERSKRIFTELTQRYGVPVSSLTAHGYGQNFAMYPQGTERERQEDRRVLVVRTR